MTEVREMLKENNIRGYRHYTKKRIDLLIEKWLLLEKPRTDKRETTKKEIVKCLCKVSMYDRN